MYTSFRIQNFKGFKDLAFDDLARVNLIAGKNNTGKTSVLEAIAVHSGGKILETLMRVKGGKDWTALFHNFYKNEEIIFSGHFADARSTFHWLDEYSLEKGEHRKSHYWRTIIVYDYSIHLHISPYEHGETRDVTEFATESLLDDENKKSFDLINLDFVSSSEHTNFTRTAKRYSKLAIKKGGISLLNDALKTLDNRLISTDILVPNGEAMIYVDVNLEQLIALSDLGEGMVKATNIISGIGNAENGVILIDEIENGLHYSILPDVWRAIDEASRLFNVQVFATTHSREVIAAAHEVFSEGKTVNGHEGYDFRYHRLTRRADDGDIVLTTYTPDVLSASLENNYEVR